MLPRALPACLECHGLTAPETPQSRSSDSSVPLQPPSQLALLPTWPGTQSRREEGKQEVLQGTGASQVTPRGCQLCLCVEELGLQSWQQRQEKYKAEQAGQRWQLALREQRGEYC